MLVKAIVGDDNHHHGTTKEEAEEEHRRRRRRTRKDGRHSAKHVQRRRRTTSTPEKNSATTTTTPPLRTRRPPPQKTSPPPVSPPRPGTAPEHAEVVHGGSRETRDNRDKHEGSGDSEDSEDNGEGGDRPVSRESVVSTSSAPDVLIGLTPYLNIHHVETVLQQIKLSLHEENVRLTQDIAQVNATLEVLYSSTSSQRRAEEEEERREEEEAAVTSHEREEKDDRRRPPTLEELKALSKSLEQRCKLEDIFQNKKLNRTIVPPLAMREVREVREVVGMVGRRTKKRVVGVKKKAVGVGSTGGRVPVQQPKPKKSSLRSRIREAQDSQYLT